MESGYAETNAQRQQELRAYRQKMVTSKVREDRKNRIFGSLRRGFSLLMMTAIVVLAYQNRDGIERVIHSKLHQIAVSHNYAVGSGGLRAGALGHEQEVDQVLQ